MAWWSAIVAAIAGADGATATRLGLAMTLLQASIGSAQRPRRRAPRCRAKAGQADPRAVSSRRGSLGLVVVAAACHRRRAVHPVRSGHRGPGRRGPGHRRRLRPPLQGDGLVVGAVRARDPAAAGLRLARDDGRPSRGLRDPPADGRRGRRRPGHLQRPGRCRARRRVGRRVGGAAAGPRASLGRPRRPPRDRRGRGVRHARPGRRAGRRRRRWP